MCYCAGGLLQQLVLLSNSNIGLQNICNRELEDLFGVVNRVGRRAWVVSKDSGVSNSILQPYKVDQLYSCVHMLVEVPTASTEPGKWHHVTLTSS